MCRHEAAAQLCLQAGLARTAALGARHTSTLACRCAAVGHLATGGYVPEAYSLAQATLKEAVAAHGEVCACMRVCRGCQGVSQRCSEGL